MMYRDERIARLMFGNRISDVLYSPQITILCPWHNDRNPSLSINLTKGMYHCFACGKKGRLRKLWERSVEAYNEKLNDG
jgi:hypothetical protein